jgi:HopA1 effector protein family
VRAAARDPEGQVAAALDAVRVSPPRAYRWLGKLVQCARDVREGGRPVLLARLEDDLYRDFYCTGGDPIPLSREQSAPAIRAAFREQLAEANTATMTWARGWTVTAIHGDAACVEYNGLRLFVQRDEIRCMRDGIEPGRRVAVAVPADRLGLSPGFYVAMGRAGDVDDAYPHTVRVYLHPRAEAATELVTRLSERLNRDAIPFRLKVVDDPRAFARCDAAVLFIPHAMFDGARPALRAVVRQLGSRLQSTTPALTKPLAPGVALAEDPGTGASFGAHRCRIIAEAVLEEALAAHGPRLADVDAVRAAFTRRGLRLDAPYLNAGSSDEYQL